LLVIGPGLQVFFKRPLKHWNLQGRHQPQTYAFVPEGSFFDRCVTLNWEIRDNKRGCTESNICKDSRIVGDLPAAVRF